MSAHARRPSNCDCDDFCCLTCGPHESRCMSEVESTRSDTEKTLRDEIAAEDGYSRRTVGIRNLDAIRLDRIAGMD